MESTEVHATVSAAGARAASAARQINLLRTARLADREGAIEEHVAGRHFGPRETLQHDAEGGFADFAAGLMHGGQRHGQEGRVIHIVDAYDADIAGMRTACSTGAHPTEREAHTKKLTPAEAAQYDARRFLAGTDGWDPTVRRQ